MHAAHNDHSTDADFLLTGPRHALATSGRQRELPAGPLSTLAERAAHFFARHGDGPRRLVGAIPYDHRANDALFQPAQEASVPAAVTVSQGLSSAGGSQVLAEPSGAHYRAAVAEAVQRIQQGEFDKIVLSRSLRLAGVSPSAAAGLLARLRRDASATVFCTPLSTTGKPPRHLLGATPELLLHRVGRQVVSHPLAGSARRRADDAADRAAGAALLASGKDRREHALAAEMVLDTLAPFCEQLSAPEGMTLASTAQMWHLGTRIEGLLRDPDTSCAELLAVLHPTPAVCGLPRAAANAALSSLEGYDRGFYAGAVGWLEANGDGCWYLALRCAELAAGEARLYAGAGIVAGSDPHAEEDETSAKFLAMLTTFGIDEHGAPVSA